MNRIFSVLVATVVVSLLFVGMGMGAAAAQENESENGTDDAIANETAAELEEDGIRPVDEDVAVTDWSFADGTFTIDFENRGERPTQVTMMEASQSDGARQISVRRERLLPGETTITISASGTPATVSITTAKSINAGSGVALSTGSDDSEDNPLRYFGGEEGLFAGMGMSVTAAGAAALFVIWREENGVVEA